MKLHLGALALKVSGGSPHLKPHLQKKTKCALSTLDVIIFLIYLPNYLITEKSHFRLCAARAQASRAPLPMPRHGTLQPATGHTVRHSLPPYATLAAILRLFSSWIVAGWYFAALAQHRQHALTRWPRPPVALLTLQMKRTRCTYSK